MAEESATLAIGGREYTFPLSEVDRLWDGSFILLWKAPPVGSRPISPGMRGQDVEWLRRRLDELEGRPPGSRPHDVYNEALKRRVQTFQRRWSLVPDGIVGEETLAQLTLAARDPRTPSLLQPNAPGSRRGTAEPLHPGLADFLKALGDMAHDVVPENIREGKGVGTTERR